MQQPHDDRLAPGGDASPTGDPDVLPARVLPVLTAEDAPFWHSGEDGVLRIVRCHACGRYNHPPYPVCRDCLSDDVAPAPVSGRGVVYSFTVNHQEWAPGMEPYVIVLVELDEQPGLRVVSNLVGCRPEHVEIGMRVEVTFRREDDGEPVWLPQFRPAP